MAWHHQLNGDSLSWLLEIDPANPSVRCFSLRDLLDLPAHDPAVIEAQAAIMTSGTVPAILESQHPEGYWENPGSGYGKYRGTEWQIIFLGELGVDPSNAIVRRGCEYLLNHSIANNGGFSAAKPPTPGGVIHCLNGNLLFALIQLGWLDDVRVQRALDWLAHAITGEPPISYLKSATSGAEFACAANANLPCGWGAVKAVKALAAVPPEQRTPLMQRALEQGAEFLLRFDLVKADYPISTDSKISASWFKLGFPLSYWSDLLELIAALIAVGYGADPRLTPVVEWLLSKQDALGRWTLEHTLNRKMWINIERAGKPSKWITLRALRVLKAIDRQA